MGGTFLPPRDVCCSNCLGNQFVIGARQAHVERTGESIPIRRFYNEHISGNDFVALVRVNRWADAQGV